MSHYSCALAAITERIRQSEGRLQSRLIDRGFVDMPHVTESPGDSGECVVCMEPFSSSGVAACSNCLQLCHEKCLQAAVALDSRCPFCRAELSTSGYLVGGVVQRPFFRRDFQGSEADLQEFLNLPQRVHAAVLASQEFYEGFYNRLDDIHQGQASLNEDSDEIKVIREQLLRLSSTQSRLLIRYAELSERVPRSSSDEVRQFHRDMLARITEGIDRLKKISDRIVEKFGALAGAKAKGEPKPKAKARDRISSRVLRRPASAIKRQLYKRPAASIRKRQPLRRPASATKRQLYKHPASSIRKRPAAATSSSSASSSRRHRMKS